MPCSSPHSSLFGCTRCSCSMAMSSLIFSLYLPVFRTPSSFSFYLVFPVRAEILPLISPRISLWFYCRNLKPPHKIQRQITETIKHLSNLMTPLKWSLYGKGGFRANSWHIHKYYKEWLGKKYSKKYEFTIGVILKIAPLD